MISRRRFTFGSVASFAAVACGPRGANPPRITHGVQAGEPERGRALIWSRCSEPARMIVEWDTTERFANPRRVAGPVVTPLGDHCGTVELAGLPDAQTIVYRVRFEREAARGASTWASGRLRTPRPDRVRVAWTGDTCGQGFGRNPDHGGLRGYAAIREAQPDVFLNSGDLIYADNPIEAEKALAGGVIWKNVTNERVARVAQELDDFRARFAYNLEDEHVRALAAEVPMIAQWDDHETHNNWWPGQQLADDRYTRERDASKLAAMARQAMFEWVPLRIGGPIHRVLHHGPLLDVFVLDCRAFRTPNGRNTGDDQMLGAAQVAWLADALAASQARWKLVACDQPISLLIDDGPNHEGFANGDPGPPTGRERELAQLVTTLKTRGVKNTVWVTADVHYTAAHQFDPRRAAGVDFDPFWEFIAGPIHAGNFGPNELDATLGPAVKFQWGTPPEGTDMLSPLDGKQSFGTLDVTRDALVVGLHDLDGHELHKVELTPA